MTLIPLLVFGALAILLVVLMRRSRTAPADRQSLAYGNDTWTSVTCTDANSDSDSHCDSSQAADCSGGDTSCDSGGGGCD